MMDISKGEGGMRKKCRGRTNERASSYFPHTRPTEFLNFPLCIFLCRNKPSQRGENIPSIDGVNGKKNIMLPPLSNTYMFGERLNFINFD
jgi:hypothetical protein